MTDRSLSPSTPKTANKSQEPIKVVESPIYQRLASMMKNSLKTTATNVKVGAI